MDVTLAYGSALTSVVLLLLIYQIGTTALRYVQRLGRFVIIKHLYYPLLWTRHIGSTGVTRLHGIFLTIYIATNVVSSVIYIQSIAQLATRSGLLAIINIVPLMLGGRTNFLLDRLSVNRNSHDSLHRWIGRVVLLQGLLHGILHLLEQDHRRTLDYRSIIVSEGRRCSHSLSLILLSF
jgi:hypothetical protein